MRWQQPSVAEVCHMHAATHTRMHMHMHTQVSGYIDYAARLKSDPHVGDYFGRAKRLMPRPSDLSFYNWETHLSTSNPTPNWQVRARTRLVGWRGGCTSPCIDGVHACMCADR